jgi:hypothetical protein
MGLDLDGDRHFYWQRRGNDKPVEQEPYTIRRAKTADMPALKQLYATNRQHSRICRVRDDALWHYELTEPHEKSPYARQMYLIETLAGQAVAYVEYRQWREAFVVREMGVRPGHSWRAVGLFLARRLKVEADKLNKDRPKPINCVEFSLGQAHPIYEALGRQLEKQLPAYAWYMRVPDLSGFLRHIAPVLEKRLADSVLAGHSGTVRLNFYHSQLTLVFADGKLQEMGTYQPKNTYDADGLFPELTFLQLLFGYRSLDELDHARADCGATNAETAVLLNILFPKQHSCVVGLG